MSLRPLLSCMFHYGQSLRPVGLDGHGIEMPGGDVECVSRAAHSVAQGQCSGKCRRSFLAERAINAEVVWLNCI